MCWTAIVIFLGDDPCVCGSFSHSFVFTGSHDRAVAFEEANAKITEHWLALIAIVPGDHPVYHPDSDE